MSRILILTLLAGWTLLVGLPQLAGAAAHPPTWPLDLETRYLTGNFMEPRAGRFHTGLDIKTNSRTGYAVVAVRDGWISRVKFSSGGYGKAVYLRGDDGLTYVYGHLGRLADDLRADVRARQAASGRYELDLGFGPSEWPVKQGDVLALSGQTATTGPHLHFEVRAADGSPLDPLAHGFSVNDTIAPEILALRAVTTGVVDPTPTLRWGDGETPLDGRLPDLFLAHGRVRFTARIVERSDHLRYRLGAWRVRLLVDEREVFASRNDRLRWRDNRQQRLEYLRTPLGQERWLWGDDRVTLAGRQTDGDFGDVALAPGRHHLRLTVEDRSGNSSEVSWVVDVDPALPAAPDPGWPASSFRLPEPWQVDGARPDPAAGTCAGIEPPVEWRRGRPERPATARWLDLAGLESLATPVQFRTPLAALLRPVAVTWPLAAADRLPASPDPAVAVYRLDDDRWRHEAPLEIRDGRATFDLDRPGVLGVLRDVAAPVIATAAVRTDLARMPAAEKHGITMPRWPVIRIPVGDHGSGVDWTSLTATLDGRPLVVEPDAPRDRVLVELPDDLPTGRHTLWIAATDLAGHTSRASLPIDLRDGGDP